jgi:hypothetical protein
MKRIHPAIIAGIALVIAAIPASAGAAVRTGSVQDPQGDVSAFGGVRTRDIKSVSVTYDDSAGSLRLVWEYYDDQHDPGGGAAASGAYNQIEITGPTGMSTEAVDVFWSMGWSPNQAQLNLVGVSGSLMAPATLSPDGRSVSMEFSDPALIGHDWRQALATSGIDGDGFGGFWFDGYAPPPPPVPTPNVDIPPATGGPPSVPTPVTGGPPSVPTPNVAIPPVTGGPPSVPSTPAPDDSHVGMTVNGGAQYTNDPDVTLSVIVPSWAGTIKVANDGGFLNVPDRPASTTVHWKLDESGSERLPKTVYVRFGRSTQTYTDDIILDQTAPVLSSAVLVKSRASAAAIAAIAAATNRTYRVRVRAKDSTSGVSKVQFAVDKRRPSKLLKFKAISVYRGAKAPRFVRVLDRAGNYGRWRSIR